METEIQESNIDTNNNTKEIIDIGAELKNKRIDLGMDEREAATRLKLPIEQVRALESNNFDYFRSKTFARGFLKNYSRLLDLDEKRLLDSLDSLAESEETTIEPVSKDVKQAQIADPIVIFVSIIIGILLIFLAFWWPTMMQDADAALIESDEPQVENDVAELEIATQDLTQIAELTLQSEIEQAELETVEVPSTSSVVTGLSAEKIALLKDAGVDPEVIEVPSKVLSTQAVVSAEIEEEIQEEVLPFYTDDLVIEYTIDCWTEIRNDKNEIIFSGIKAAGSTLEITEGGTYKVVLGYAPGVKSLVFKGEEIDIAPYTRQDLTRIELK
ncbi:helix-turn-helix domain-containing protein [Marinomonas agarivorans]|nr:helix-turn-helix domain-containing protein [Marinomonas agarivorans]